MFHRTTKNVKEACGSMYGKMEKSLKLLRRIYFVEIIVLLIVGGIVGVFMSLYAAPNKSFIYQGRITGADFLPLDDATYFMRIKLFDASTGGNCLWSTGADRTGANCAAANSAANIPVVLTRSLFSVPIGDTAYHANMPNIASLDFKTTTYFMDVSFATASGGTYDLFTTRTKLGSAASAVTVLDALQANTFNQVPGSYTQINDAAGITAAAATITVDSTAAYPSAGTILIDTEVMAYTGTTATTFTGVTRGALGTTAATHADNATIKTYLFSGAAGNTTLINDATGITAAATTITVDSTAGYPTSAAIRIDNEIITYTGLTATTFTGASRGARGTTAATHADNAIVKLDIFPAFFITSDGSAFVNSNSTSLNPQIGFQVSGTTNYTLGIDRLADSTVNKFKISTNNIGTAGTGQITASGSNVTGIGTAFTTQISVGSNITVAGQTRTVDSIATNTALTVETPFSPAITSATSFTFTNNLLALDSRSTFTTGAQYSAFTFYGLNNTLASAANANYTTLTVTPPIITLSGSTPVTSLMDSIFFGRPTIASIAQGITDASTFTVAGPPLLTAGAMTNAYALKINTASVNGGAAPTNAYGLAVAAPTGATNNYAAIFTGGNVGVGTTAPITQLHVAGNVPSDLRTTTTASGPRSIAVQGRYAYITNSTANTLEIYDVSNPGTSFTGTGTISSSGTTVTGTGTAFTTQLAVGDTITTTTGAGTGTISSSGTTVTGTGTAFTTQLAVGDTITASGQSKIITTITNATSLTIDSTFASNLGSGTYFNFFRSRTVTAITNATSLTIDSTFASNLGGGTAFTFVEGKRISTIPTGAGPAQVVVQGKYAYVINQSDDTIQIFNISNPATPASMGTAVTQDAPTSIAVQGRYAYIVNSTQNSFQIFDISNPASPSAVSSTIAATGTISNTGTGTTVTGTGTAFTTQLAVGDTITAGGQSKTITAITNATSLTTNTAFSPEIAGGTTFTVSGTNPVGVVVNGRYAYVTSNVSNSFQIIDVSNPTSPSIAASKTAGTTTLGIAVQGRYAYVTNYGADTLQVFDISNPTSPTSVSTVAAGDGPSSVAISGRYAYITNRLANTLQAFDISNPASLSSIGTVSTGTLPMMVAIQGRYAYVPNLTSGNFKIYDIGGSYIQQAEVGGLEIANGSVRNNLTVYNSLDVRGGVNIGLGGLYSAGPLSITGLEGASGAQSALDVRNSDGTSVFFVQNSGKIGFTTTAPSYDLSFGAAQRTIGVESQTGSNAGNNLLLQAGNSGTGNDLAGGSLIFRSGNSTGTGASKVQFSVPMNSTTPSNSNSSNVFFEFVNGHIASLATASTPALPRVNNSGTCTNGILGTAATLNGGHSNTITTITVNSTSDYPAMGISTTLNGLHNNSVTTINVADATAFPTSGTLSIDTEIMTYTGKTPTTFTGVTRGTNGTSAASHNDTTTVRLLGILIIADEIMTYTGTTATTFTGVTRGTNGTIASAQSNGASVRLYPANTDVGGKILFTGASSACTLEFAKSYTNAPSCVASFEDLDSSGSVTVRTTAIGVSSVTFGLNGTVSANDKLSYFCVGLGSQ